MIYNKDVVWYVGNWYFNIYSIGIEYEGFVFEGFIWFMEEMYCFLVRFVCYFVKEYNIFLD